LLYYSDGCTVPGVTDLAALQRVGKALVDPTRCAILVCLLDGPHYPTELAAHLGLTKANVSNHLACLRGCGLVGATPEGRRVRYELADERLAHALTDLAGLASRLAATCEVEQGVAS
jgi:ArsR family transcriptional regulator, cadmium/lead-responsive transcriptional repressor